MDDRKDVAATLAELCRTLGFAAVVGEEGSDIRTQLERLSPAALIIDVMMPDQDGYEALKEIAAFNPGLPVLLVTGYGETWLRMGATLGRAHGLRALQTASKPVRTDTVRRFLATLSAPA
ncbi:MAG: response regulator [Rhodospirillales bacterium]|nr:response regulator [Rhodospirillales bacterium]